ncbi:MAG: glycosyltransferase involved in cell wall biosynthesis [Crocinitomicaceae bacterium]|jgi:glycosyltransferase involved in cell wall biosynthesis
MKKVLIITYYWPPSGGAGVQRWLKLSKYLCEMGVEVHVLSVDEKYASYVQLDPSLTKDIHPDVHIHKTKSIEPINLYTRLSSKNKEQSVGFSNDGKKKIKTKVLNGIRSNFFIPDPRKGWKRFAVKKALELIRDEKINTVITTSPPHSVQLIGLKLKKKIKFNWIVDLRDPWTDIYYYDQIGHTSLSKKIDRKIEQKVIHKSDHITTVSDGLKTIFLTKSSENLDSKISIIPNGFDPADFLNEENDQKSEDFTICYTGAISQFYNPAIFFDALHELRLNNPETIIKFQLVGTISKQIVERIEKLEIPYEHIKTVPHEEIHRYQRQADLLLLVIPDVKLDKGIVTGKIFEYLASKKPVIAIGPTRGDAALILEECNAGKTFDRKDVTPIYAYLQEALKNYQNNVPNEINEDALQKYSRKYQAAQFEQML